MSCAASYDLRYVILDPFSVPGGVGASVDQRGSDRPAGSGCDLGAAEQ